MAREPNTASRRPRADALRNRERLLAAAAEVFRTGGPEASLEAVARRAAVGIGTLYRHFPTREALFEAVYRREVEQLVELGATLSADEPPERALRLWLHAGVGMAATKRGMLTALALAVDSSSQIYRYSSTQLTRAAGALIGRAREAGAIRGDVGAEDILQVLVGLSLMGRQPGWEATVVRLIDVFVDGLRVPEAARDPSRGSPPPR